jgi:hypothetical protein
MVFPHGASRDTARTVAARQSFAGTLFHPQHIEYNLLYRWFVGLSLDDKVWATTSFCENRERLFPEAIMREFFGRIRVCQSNSVTLVSHHNAATGTRSSPN